MFRQHVAAIMVAMEKLDDEEASRHQLVGDLSTHHALPVLQRSKHKDLASISPSTVIFHFSILRDESVD